MSRKQLLVIILLGLADCIILGGLVAVMVLTPRFVGPRATPTGQPVAYETATPTLPPTWTPTASPTPAPTQTPRPTQTRPPTRTPAPTIFIPTNTPTPTPTPQPIRVTNGTFDSIHDYSIPGWEVSAFQNWNPGDEFIPEVSYYIPHFKAADDVRRFIDGNTLQIEPGHQYLRFNVTVYQIVEIAPDTVVRFQIQAGGFSTSGGMRVRAGIDARGRAACDGGRWSATQVIDQTMDVITLRTPDVTVGTEGRVAVCFFAEPEYSASSMAAYFDNAEIRVVSQPR